MQARYNDTRTHAATDLLLPVTFSDTAVAPLT